MTWPGKPRPEYAAQALKDRLLPSVHLVPSVRRGESEPTVSQIRSYGIEIVSIKPAAPPPGARGESE